MDKVLTEDQIKKMRGNYDELRIYFNLTRSENMNVYLYGGMSRTEATHSIVDGNAQPEIAKLYSIEYSNGMVVVAYPNEQTADQQITTAIEFDYWIDVYDLPGSKRWLFSEFDTEKLAIIGLTFLAFFIILLLSLCALVCYRQMKSYRDFKVEYNHQYALKQQRSVAVGEASKSQLSAVWKLRRKREWREWWQGSQEERGLQEEDEQESRALKDGKGNQSGSSQVELKNQAEGQQQVNATAQLDQTGDIFL